MREATRLVGKLIVHLLAYENVLKCSRCKVENTANWEARLGKVSRYYCDNCLDVLGLMGLTETPGNREMREWRAKREATR